MKCQAIALILLIAVLTAGYRPAMGFETDQYNLSPEPLADIGEEVSSHVNDRIVEAIAKVNSQIAAHEACVTHLAAGGAKCDSPARESDELRELRSADAIVDAVYDVLGKGSIFTTVTGKWFAKHSFRNEPSRYKSGFGHSIFITRPINYATISPTVKMFGVEFGFDKIDHFFQQGHKYYELYGDAIKRGRSAEEASQEAVRWGKRTERTYFGTLVSGVYSNGDLFANYAGMKFYQNLTSEISLAGRTYPSIVVLEDGKWTIRARSEENVLRPFIGDQLNEALNPSGFSFLLAKVVKSVVKKHACPDWRRLYPNGTAKEFEDRSASLETWNGEDYGFTHKSHTVPITVCFEEKLLRQQFAH